MYVYSTRKHSLNKHFHTHTHTHTHAYIDTCRRKHAHAHPRVSITLPLAIEASSILLSKPVIDVGFWGLRGLGNFNH